MDNFTYNYPNIGSAPSNRLGHVDDLANGTTFTDDIDDQSANNYGYDELGQLISDQQELIANIEWRSGDKKIKEIIRTGNNPDYEFRYNPFGQRILKIEKPKVNNELQTRDWWRYTYYTYDANGQVMATYEVSLNSGFKYAYLKDQNIYGASRLGMRKNYMALYSNVPVPYVIPAVQQNTLGNIAYEITNYLGNVNVVISDRKIWTGTPTSAFKACIVSRTDYFPFGMEISSRTTNSDNYRFGYNGMESDDETKGSGNSYTTEFRQYDPRLGRWLSLDPLMAQYPMMSPYVAFNNNPIFFVDPLGLEGECPGEPEKNDKELHTKDENNNDVKLSRFKTWWIKNQNRNVRDAVNFSKDKENSTINVSKNSNGKWNASVKWSNEDPEVKGGMVFHNKSFPALNLSSSLGQFDGTVISFLPWYQIGRGIQDIQAGDNWGWFKIGIEIVPLGVFGKGLQIFHKLKVTNLAKSVIKSSLIIRSGKTLRGIQALSKKIGRGDIAFSMYKKATQESVNEIINNVLKAKNQFVNITRNQQGVEVIDIFNLDSKQGVRLIKETGEFDTFISYSK